MGQILTYGLTHELLRTLEKTYGCTSQPREKIVDTLVTANMSKTLSNERESRPYPLNPFREVTSQNRQYRLKAKSAICRTQWYQTGTYCGNPIFEKRGYYANPIEECPHHIDGEITNWGGRLRNEIKDLSLNLGPSLVEYRETRNMFVSAAKSLINVVHRAKGGLYRGGYKWQKHNKALCKMSAAHLQTTYGVMPLVSDLYDSVEILKSKLGKDLYRRFSAYDSRSGAIPSQVIGASRLTGRWAVSERATLYIKLLPNYDGFTVGNPAEWIWEATFLSFVVDWFVNIGDWLSSLDALRGVELYTGTRTRKQNWWVTHEVEPWPTVKGLPFVHSQTGRTDYNSHERFLITNIPLPVLRWRPTDSWHALVNATALLKGQSKECKRSS